MTIVMTLFGSLGSYDIIISFTTIVNNGDGSAKEDPRDHPSFSKDRDAGANAESNPAIS